jgi:hypothetical protein
MNHYLLDFNEKVNSSQKEVDGYYSKIEICLERTNIVLQKYYNCLKSQQNQNRV